MVTSAVFNIRNSQIASLLYSTHFKERYKFPYPFYMMQLTPLTVSYMSWPLI